MCSELCPCPKSAEKLWTSYSEADLRKMSRTKNAKGMTPAEQSDYKANKEKAKIVPLFFAAEGQKSYSTFEECYNDKLSKEDYFKCTACDEEEDHDLSEFFDEENQGFELVDALETKYECASFCQVPLFYITKDVALGKPTRECSVPMLTGMGEQLKPLSPICFGAAFLLFFGLIFSIPYCGGVSKDEEERHLLQSN